MREDDPMHRGITDSRCTESAVPSRKGNQSSWARQSNTAASAVGAGRPRAVSKLVPACSTAPLPCANGIRNAKR